MSIKNLFKFVFVWAALVGTLPTMAAFKDVKIDFTNDKIMTSADADITTIGIAVADDGTVTRVAADDATAALTVTGKYHSTQHGLANFSATIAVEGPVKIGMGSCNWGGDVTIKNATGETCATFNTNNGACWSTANGADVNVIYGYYNGEATTLTISGGSYTPYISVEAVTEIITEYTVSYSLGGVAAEGILPAAEKVVEGKSITIPANFTLYAEGKTLTGWTDGTTTYTAGQEVVMNADLALTPIFTDNTVSLNDRTEAVTITWDFQRKNGAPTVAVQSKTMIWVAQAVVNGKTIDVKMPIDATNGKVANGSWSDWAQLNSGTILTIPAYKGTVVSLESYEATTTTTIAGDVINQGTTTPTYTYEGSAESIDIVIGDGSYWRTVKVDLPARELVVTDGEDLNAEGTYVGATYERKFNTEYTYGTICLPFAPDAETCANYTFYKLMESNSTTLYFEEETEPKANVAYLYKLNEGVDAEEAKIFTGGVTTISEVESEAVGGWQLIGSFKKETITDLTDGQYFAYKPVHNEKKDVFVKATNSLTVKPYRAYFKFVETQSLNFAPAAAVMFLSIGGEYDGTNEIEKVVSPEEVEGAVFDMEGRPVEKMQEGKIYIVGGQKVIK